MSIKGDNLQFFDLCLVSHSSQRTDYQLCYDEPFTEHATKVDRIALYHPARSEASRTDLQRTARSTHYYLSGNYEMEKTLADTKEILYLSGSYYEAPAVYVKEGQKTDMSFN